MEQLVETVRDNQRLKEIFIQQLEIEYFDNTQNAFRERVKEIDPPELKPN